MNTDMSGAIQVFEDHASSYDAWFDSPKGKQLFELELGCLRALKPTDASGTDLWLEVGTGSGRFAQALGVPAGVEPAPAMAKLANARGIETMVATGEHLPYSDATLKGVLIVCTICFVQDAARVFKECARVLQTKGHLLLGFVPSDSLWGQFHSLRGQAGHTYYSNARFFTQAEIVELAMDAGLSLEMDRQVELPAPAPDSSDYLPGMNPEPGVSSFQGLLFQKK